MLSDNYNKRKILFTSSVIFFLCCNLNAVTLRGDRPEFTQNSEIVPDGRFQTESGYTFTQKINEKEHKIGELTIRIGVFSSVETIFGINSYRVAEKEDKNMSGKDDPSFGLKVRLLSAPNYFLLWNPNFAVYAGTFLPTGKSKTDTREDAYQPAGKIILSWPLIRIVEIGVNFNYTYISENAERFHQLAEGVSLRINMYKAFGFFSEYYSYQPESKNSGNTHYIKIGLTISPIKQSRLDFHAGRGINNKNDDKYAGGGIVYRYY